MIYQEDGVQPMHRPTIYNALSSPLDRRSMYYFSARVKATGSVFYTVVHYSFGYVWRIQQLLSPFKFKDKIYHVFKVVYQDTCTACSYFIKTPKTLAEHKHPLKYCNAKLLSWTEHLASHGFLEERYKMITFQTETFSKQTSFLQFLLLSRVEPIFQFSV